MGKYDIQLFVNPQAEYREYGDGEREILNQEAFAEAKGEIRSWPGHEPTPLIELQGLAEESRVGGR